MWQHRALQQQQQQQEAPQEDAGVAALVSAANKPAAAVFAVERSAAGNIWSRLRKRRDKVGKDLAATRNMSQPMNITSHCAPTRMRIMNRPCFARTLLLLLRQRRPILCSPLKLRLLLLHSGLRNRHRRSGGGGDGLVLCTCWVIPVYIIKWRVRGGRYDGV